MPFSVFAQSYGTEQGTQNNGYFVIDSGLTLHFASTMVE